MTDFTLLSPRPGAAAKPRRAGLGFVRAGFAALMAAVADRLNRHRARRALRLPLAHMSDAQLRDIGLRRCDHSFDEAV